MSCARTFVSRRISSPPARPPATASTATPVTNIASVASMKGAPRIAPTPIPCDAEDPAPERMAMIGIIVSGSAVPTAARTDPTAPSASSSFRPNHSMPFVKSSAPARITTNARTSTSTSTSALEAGRRDDAEKDHQQDHRRDEGHPSLAPPAVADERCRHAGSGRRDDDDEPGGDEPRRPEREEIRRHAREVERRRAGERVDAVDEHQAEADGKQRDRGIGAGGQQPPDRLLEPDLGEIR